MLLTLFKSLQYGIDLLENCFKIEKRLSMKSDSLFSINFERHLFYSSKSEKKVDELVSQIG
jgi:hypothetical protein